MSSIAERMQSVTDAVSTPAVTLLNHKWAPFVVAVLRASFPAESTGVRAERLHAQVDAYLDELSSLGLATPPQASGRTLCLQWTHERWLARVPTQDGGEAYERTSHALVADRVLEELGQDRALLSESRLTTILDTAARWASAAAPDPAARLRDIDASMAALEAERAALTDGAALPPADNVRMAHGFDDLFDLLAQLPGDFRRVEESLDAIHRTMIREFRADARPKGEILDHYLESSTHLMDRTPEGRAFGSALAILGDDGALESLRAHLRTILDHPFATSVPVERRRAVLGAASTLRRGLYEVQSRQHRASRSLADHLAQADLQGEREVERLLGALESRLDTWMQHSRTRDTLSVEGMPARADIGHLRMRLNDPRPAPGPEPLIDVAREAPPAPNLDAVRLTGGPLSAEVRAAVGERVLSGAAASLGEAFTQLPDALRRPVELFELMDLATELTDGPPRAALTDEVLTVRPDGSTRLLSLPRLTPEPARLRQLAEDTEAVEDTEDTDATSSLPTHSAKDEA